MFIIAVRLTRTPTADAAALVPSDLREVADEWVDRYPGAHIEHVSVLPIGDHDIALFLYTLMNDRETLAAATRIFSELLAQHAPGWRLAGPNMSRSTHRSQALTANLFNNPEGDITRPSLNTWVRSRSPNPSSKQLGAQGESNESEPKPAMASTQRLKRIVHHWGKWVATLLTVSLLLSGADGCTATDKHATPSAAKSSRMSSTTQPTANALVDPLSEITDKKDRDYIAESIQPLLHANGLGPSHYDLHIETKTHSVRVYVVCTPDSPFYGNHRQTLLRTMCEKISILCRHSRRNWQSGRNS